MEFYLVQGFKISMNLILLGLLALSLKLFSSHDLALRIACISKECVYQKVRYLQQSGRKCCINFPKNIQIPLLESLNIYQSKFIVMFFTISFLNFWIVTDLYPIFINNTFKSKIYLNSFYFLIQSNLAIRNGLIRNKLVLRNHFLWPICHLLHKDKELLALRNNFRVTKKFLIAKFDCIRYQGHNFSL